MSEAITNAGACKRCGGPTKRQNVFLDSHRHYPDCIDYLMRDKERLDWLENREAFYCGIHPYRGGWSIETEGCSEHGLTLRSAIDAMQKAQASHQEPLPSHLWPNESEADFGYRCRDEYRNG